MQSPRGDTEDQKEVFDVFAKFSKDGVIAEDDVIVALRHLNQYLTNSAKSELDKDFPSKGLNFDEFLTLFQAVQEINSNEADLIEAFSSLDKNKTGFIPAADVIKLLIEVGGLSEDEATAVIESSTDGADGTLSYNAVAGAIGSFVA